MSKKFKKVIYKHGVNEIIIKNPNTEIPLEMVGFYKESLKEILKEQRKELQEHFKNHGWNLDRDSIRADILRELLGFDILELIDHSLVADSPVAIDAVIGEYVLKAGYSPIYLDTYTGEIILVDNPQDKSYIMKYREINGFELIGFL